jgi:hypothetical protein
VRRVGATLLLAALLSLAGCGDPVFVPKTGPGAPGYAERALPKPLDVEIVPAPQGKPRPPGGSLDSIDRRDGSFTLTGWALVNPDSPRGELEVVVPRGVDATVQEVTTVPRTDVVAALGSQDLIWSGFQVTLAGTLPDDQGVCVLSRSKQGAYRLNNSDVGLCPA